MSSRSKYEIEGIEYVIGSAGTVAGMEQVRALHPFEDIVVDFLDAVSTKLRGNREFPDVATFGFWCRRAAVLNEKEHFEKGAAEEHRLGKGIVFHSTPSNVPVNFAFSFAAGLLAGNANIVRLPAKDFPQVGLICDAIRQTLDEMEAKGADLRPYICFVKYASSKEINDAFSGLCDTRVIWGGDATIERMRRSQLKPRANEITFADRHSIVVIDAGKYLEAGDKGRIAKDFFSDTLYTDQNACTSPRAIFWLNKAVEAADSGERAKRDFWQHFREEAAGRYSLEAVQTVGKLDALCMAAVKCGARSCEDDPDVDNRDWMITRVTTDKITSEIMDCKYNSGFFFEYDISALDEMLPVCDEKCQTLTYYGVSREEISEFIDRCRPAGIDRAVPMGRSMDFALIWDGHDLIREMSRAYTV